MPDACFKFVGAALVGILLLSISSTASAQKIRMGVLVGASLTDDYRNASLSFHGVTYSTQNASQWFMIGPTLDVGLTDNVSIEVNAIRRRIRYTELTAFGTPMEGTFYQFGPFLSGGYTWQISTLGKYKFSGTRVRPFTELGLSFLPIENRDKTGITAGLGMELPVGRVSFTPTVRYTNWVTKKELGEVTDRLQFLVGIHENSESRRPTIMGRPLSLGFVAGTGITKLLKDRSDRSDPVFQFVETSDPHTPIAGIRFELPVTEKFSVEVDGLFRGTHEISGLVNPDGSIRRTEYSGSAFLTWEFPLLAKYKILASKVAPVFELGPSVRITAHTQSKNYSHYGATAGVGVATRFKKMSISPTLRYTRWAADKKLNGREPFIGTSRNQVEVVVGFTF